MTAEQIRELGSLSENQLAAVEEFQKARREARRTCFQEMVHGLLQYLMDQASEDDKVVLNKMLVQWNAHTHSPGSADRPGM